MTFLMTFQNKRYNIWHSDIVWLFCNHDMTPVRNMMDIYELKVYYVDINTMQNWRCFGSLIFWSLLCQVCITQPVTNNIAGLYLANLYSTVLFYWSPELGLWSTGLQSGNWVTLWTDRWLVLRLGDLDTHWRTDTDLTQTRELVTGHNIGCRCTHLQIKCYQYG